MDALQQSLHLILYLGHGIFVLRHQRQNINLISTIVHLPHGLIGQIYRGFRIAADIDTARTFSAHAYDAIVDAVDTEELSTRIINVRKQLLRHAFSYHTHLPVLQTVGIRQGTSMFHLGVVHMDVIGIYPHQGDATGLVVCQSPCPPVVDGGCDNVNLGHQVSYALHVAQFQVPNPTTTETLIRFAGGVGNHESCIGSCTRKVLSQHGFQPSTTAHQKDEHEHTPEDAKGRQKRTCTILSKGVEDFLPQVCVQ